MDAAAVSSKVVTGRRVAWWRGVLAQPSLAVFVFASPPLLLIALYKLVFRHASMFELGYAFWGTIALITAVGCIVLYGEWCGGQPVEAACPVCGARGLWPYQAPVDVPDPLRHQCETCGVYVGINGLELREVALDATGEFVLDADRYTKIVPRDAKKHVVLEMPPFCASCGAAAAVVRRPIDIATSGGGGTSEVWREVNYARSGTRHGVGTSTPEALRLDLDHVQVPVCEQHATSRPMPVRADSDATLRFASYRYCKAFCHTNGILRIERR